MSKITNKMINNAEQEYMDLKKIHSEVDKIIQNIDKLAKMQVRVASACVFLLVTLHIVFFLCL